MPYDLGRLGTISGSFDLVDWALVVVKGWLPSAVRAVNDGGYTSPDGQMLSPMSYGRIPLSTSVIEDIADQVPAVFISSPGTTGTPIKNGHDVWASWYTLNVTVVDRAQDWDTTAKRAQLWAALVRAVVLANQTLRGNVQQVEWQSESYNPIPAEQGRTYAGSTVTFRVLVPDVTVVGDIGPLSDMPGDPDPVSGVADPLPDGLVVTAFEGDITSEPLP